MIISCPSCKKSFQIDENLIPVEGRNLQCGSCSHVWFFKKEKSNLELKKEIFLNNEIESDQKVQKEINISKNDSLDEIKNNTDKALIKYDESPKITLTNSIQPSNSCSIWSSVTNRCASSCVNPLTLVIPEISPDCSQR